MMRLGWFATLCALTACSVDHTGLLPSGDGGAVDSEQPLDVGVDAPPDVPGFDGGRDVGGFDGGPDARMDAGPMDAGGEDGGPDAGPDAGPMDAGCMFEPRCSADGLSLETCRDGSAASARCPVRCEDTMAPATCVDLDPTNGLRDYLLDDATSQNLVYPTVPDYEAAGGFEYDTTDCADLPNSRGLMTPPGGTTPLCVFAFEDVRIEGKMILVGPYGVAIVATGNITIADNATIRADGAGQPGGAGGGDGATVGSPAGGPFPGPSGEHRDDYDDSGGSGGGNATRGGAGGRGGDAPQPPRSEIGSGMDLLDPIHGGSGGGLGAGGDQGGEGGGGGGALILVARGNIVFNGLIDIGGAGGGGGRTTNNWGAGGGGGSGGGLVFEAGGELVVGPNARVMASGGGGGGSASCRDGSNGDPERPENDPIGGAGGRNAGCSVGTSADGGDGARDGDAEGGDDNRGFGGNGGGGGGGRGIIVVRAVEAPATPYGRSGTYRSDAPRFIAVD